ncbi:hypothetical protein D3C87_2059630 [compost metagenome]
MEHLLIKKLFPFKSDSAAIPVKFTRVAKMLILNDESLTVNTFFKTKTDGSTLKISCSISGIGFTWSTFLSILNLSSGINAV